MPHKTTSGISAVSHCAGGGHCLDVQPRSHCDGCVPQQQYRHGIQVQDRIQAGHHDGIPMVHIPPTLYVIIQLTIY